MAANQTTFGSEVTQRPPTEGRYGLIPEETTPIMQHSKFLMGAERTLQILNTIKPQGPPQPSGIVVTGGPQHGVVVLR